MQRARGAVSVVLAASAIALVAPPNVVSATTMIRLSTEELTVTSELVVEAVVSSVESRFREDHRYVYTYVALDVERTLKGSAPSSAVVLEELGGSANGMNVTVPGSPVFEVGERVIVFLEPKEGSEFFRTVAMAQGKFSIVDDVATGGRHLTRPEIIEASFNAAPDGRLDSTVDPSTGRRGYEVFVKTVTHWADRLAVPGGAR
jgi:hypothetical protein